MPTVTNTIIQAHALAAQSKGVTVEPLMLEYGLQPEAILAGQGRSDSLAFGRWLGEQWRSMDDETGGFSTQRMKAGTFAMANHAILGAGTLRRALQRSAQFYGLVSEALVIRFTETHELARLEVALTDRSPLDRRVFIDSLLIIWWRWFSWLVDTPLQLERVELGFVAPPYGDEYPQIYGCQPVCEQTTSAFYLNAAYLDLPVQRTEEQLTEFLSQAPAFLLTHYRRHDQLAQQLRHLFSTHEHPAALDQTAAATLLNLSASTLRRCLREEGTGFQRLKDQWRKTRAIYLLKSTDASLHHIAQTLGFSEASAFHRAFQSWTGENPGAVRQRSIQGTVDRIYQKN